MDRNSVNWSGPMPAVTTPFDDEGRIDEQAFADNVSRLMDAGSTGIVAGGCTGEFWALSRDERKRLYRVAVEATAGRGTVIVGTGAVTVEETVELTKDAEEAGVDGALILPPYFVKLTDDEIVAHFQDVSDRTGLPILLYNIPGNAVNALPPALVARLADVENVVAVKESSGDWNNWYGTFLAVARPAARLLRPVLRVRRAGGGSWRRRRDRLLSQCLGTRRARPLSRRGARRPHRGQRAAGDRPPADRPFHVGRPHALSRHQGGDGHDEFSGRRQAAPAAPPAHRRAARRPAPGA